MAGCNGVVHHCSIGNACISSGLEGGSLPAFKLRDSRDLCSWLACLTWPIKGGLPSSYLDQLHACRADLARLIRIGEPKVSYYVVSKILRPGETMIPLRQEVTTSFWALGRALGTRGCRTRQQLNVVGGGSTLLRVVLSGLLKQRYNTVPGMIGLNARLQVRCLDGWLHGWRRLVGAALLVSPAAYAPGACLKPDVTYCPVVRGAVVGDLTAGDEHL